MKKIFIIITCLLVLFSAVGCSNRSIKLVKKGSFVDYPQVKIGKFLDNVNDIDKVKWEYIKSKKGEKLVTYRGRLKLEEFPMLKKMWEIYVYIEFNLDADGKDFDLGYSSIELERVNLKDNELFDLTQTNDEQSFDLLINDSEQLLSLAYNDDFSSYLRDLEKRCLKRGLELALEEYSVEKLEKLKSLGIDFSAITLRAEKQWWYGYGQVNPLEYIYWQARKAIWNRDGKKIYEVKDLQKEEKLFSVMKFLHENGVTEMEDLPEYSDSYKEKATEKQLTMMADFRKLFNKE